MGCGEEGTGIWRSIEEGLGKCDEAALSVCVSVNTRGGNYNKYIISGEQSDGMYVYDGVIRCGLNARNRRFRIRAASLC